MYATHSYFDPYCKYKLYAQVSIQSLWMGGSNSLQDIISRIKQTHPYYLLIMIF